MAAEDLDVQYAVQSFRALRAVYESVVDELQAYYGPRFDRGKLSCVVVRNRPVLGCLFLELKYRKRVMLRYQTRPSVPETYMYTRKMMRRH